MTAIPSLLHFGASDVSRKQAVSSTSTENTAAQAETNTPAVKEPKTGDSGNHLFVWITLLAVSGGVAAGIVVYSRKRKETEAE